jgi:hypothetical protein
VDFPRPELYGASEAATSIFHISRARSGGLRLPHQSELSSSIHTATSEGTNLGKKSMQRAGLELWKDDEGGVAKIAAP